MARREVSPSEARTPGSALELAAASSENDATCSKRRAKEPAEVDIEFGVWGGLEIVERPSTRSKSTRLCERLSGVEMRWAEEGEEIENVATEPSSSSIKIAVDKSTFFHFPRSTFL